MALVTVIGAGNSIITLDMTSAANARVAQQLLDGVSQGVLGGSISPYSYAGSGPLHPPSGPSLMVLTGPGSVTIPAGTGTVFDTSTQRDVLFGGTGASQLVVAGNSGITYFGNTGSGTVIAGGGDNTIFIGGSTRGNNDDDDRDGEHRDGDGRRWRSDHDNRDGSDRSERDEDDDHHRAPQFGSHVILTGAGNDRIYALSGDATIGAGGGNNTIVLGTGTAAVSVTGHDWIQGGGGSATVDATGGGQAQVYGDRGAITFIGGDAASTVIGGQGAVTASGGAGGGVFVGGFFGSNQLQAGSGAATLFGGGNGDRLGGGAANDLLFAGQGIETLQGGGGNDSFAFVKGDAGGHDLIQDFNVNQDALMLLGYERNAFYKALTTATQTSDGTTITLSDHTQVTFVGLSSAALHGIAVVTGPTPDNIASLLDHGNHG